MSSFFWWAVGLGASGFFAWRAGRIWLDAGRLGFQLPQRFGLALVGMISPSRYWWGARIAALSFDERAGLLARETAALGQSRADSVRCPLCGAEILRAWRLDAAGRPAVAPGHVQSKTGLIPRGLPRG